MYCCSQCSKCLFYNHDREWGDSCYFFSKEEESMPQFLRWVTGSDMVKNPELYHTYHTPCKGFVSEMETLKEKKAEVMARG